MKKMLIYLALALILCSFASALGVAPAYKKLFFEPNTVHKVTLTIVNNEQKDLNIMLIDRNELAPYVTVPDEVIHMRSDEYSKDIEYEVRMPDKLAPGTRVADIMIVPVEDNDTDASMIKTAVAIIHQLRVVVPYPDQYLQGTLYVSKDGRDVTISLANLGDKRIEDIQGTVIISDPNSDTVINMETISTSLDPKQQGKIFARYDKEISPGKYKVEAIVRYDGKTLLLDKEIDIGDPFIEITGLRSEMFKLGAIARLDLELKNQWNRMITNVYSDITIKDSLENTVAEEKTTMVDIPASGNSEVPIYWDTKGIDTGDYTIGVKTHYMGRFTEKTFESTVSDNSLVIKGGDTTGQVTTGNNEMTFTSVMIILLILLIGLVAYLIRRLPKKKAAAVIPKESETYLKNYIRDKLKDGYSRDNIRKNLEGKGWNKEAIDAEMMKVEDEDEKNN